MKKIKVLSIIGTRPQLIKEAILSPELKKEGINEILIDSGQHYDKNMSNIFFENLKIKIPYINMHVGSGSHAQTTGRIMINFEKLLQSINPDLIIVFGDTNTTLAGAIAGVKLKYKIAHVEAGIRMKPKKMPEEINRVLVDRISDLLFCPSKLSISNLKYEGITEGVFFVGDVMFDLYLRLEKMFNYNLFKKLRLEDNRFVLTTIHRDYNVDRKTKLEMILKALNKINNKIPVVFPIHPRTRKRIIEYRLEKYVSKLTMIDPIDYLSLMGLVKKSYKIITDSGGLQKETYFAKKRALVFSEDTGWRELIETGWNTLCDEYSIDDLIFKDSMVKYIPNIYGNGNAGGKIVKIIKKLNDL